MQHNRFSSSELAGIQASEQTTSTLPWNLITPSEGFLISAAAATIAIAIVSAKFAAFQTMVLGI